MQPFEVRNVRDKTGMFFTISALILLGILFTSLIFQGRYSLSEQGKVIAQKTSSLQNFASGLEKDAERGLFIASFRAVLGAEDTILSTNKFLDDAKAGILEAMTNGTINGTSISGMDKSTLYEWRSRMVSSAAKLGMLLNISFNDLSVNQSSPLNVEFAAIISFNITDTANTATFFKSKRVTTSISIIGFDDPIYAVFTGGRIIRQINITPYEGNYASGLDTTNLKDHINRLYYANSTGPSFLMRLEGNLNNSPSGSPIGIESIVKLPDLAEQGLPVYERSSIDYIYFGNATPTIYIINQTFEDWLRLDEDHLYKYQVYDIRK